MWRVSVQAKINFVLLLGVSTQSNSLCSISSSWFSNEASNPTLQNSTNKLDQNWPSRGVTLIKMDHKLFKSRWVSFIKWIKSWSRMVWWVKAGSRSRGESALSVVLLRFQVVWSPSSQGLAIQSCQFSETKCFWFLLHFLGSVVQLWMCCKLIT